MQKSNGHSTSRTKAALSGFDPQSTTKPRFTRAGHPDSSAIQAEIATPVKTAKNGGPK